MLDSRFLKGEMMKKMILSAVVSLFPISAFAGMTAGLSGIDFAGDLNGIAAAAVENIASNKAEAVKPANVEAVKSSMAEPRKTGAYVNVSGRITLTGSGFVQPNGGFTTIPMSGWIRVKDNIGEITSNNTYVYLTASMWIHPNQYVFQTIWPNVNVQLYKDGKPIGFANVSNNISVSGFPSGNMIYLNGSGYLTGSVYVEDAVYLRLP
jgi:hypothetical protein